MNLKQRHNLLEENIRLKKEHNELSSKVDDLQKSLDDVKGMIVELLNRPSNQIIVSDNKETIKHDIVPKKSESVFIPSVSTGGLTNNISDPKKKIRTTNIHDAASKLSKITEPEK